ncbi:PepSY-associated TM helix domain-containing protein [Ottowia thiooxydans]|uniref:Iron-regulated membrane protein n=1 Tax=Ottowia thiooxydans TaxID=219182 RepID=A0ABV2Q378_9BURK
MFQNLRQSMAWLHTWFGLVLGFVLMVCFFFGSMSVFDREIDRWAIASSRFAPQPMPSFDKVLRPVFEAMQPDESSRNFMRNRVNGTLPEHFNTVHSWEAYTTHRDPVLSLFSAHVVPNAKDPEEAAAGTLTIDPRSGAALPQDRLKIGSEFFYPLHYSLNLSWKRLGTWIGGFAALVMLVALVSGLVMHRKVFREFFTFRSHRSSQRSTLDLHNMAGVLALPFHFFFAFTGMVISAGVYFPVSDIQLGPLHELHEKLEFQETGLPHERAGVAAPLASVDAMVAEAQRRWELMGMAGEVGFLSINHVGDDNGFVSIYRAGTDRIALVGDGIHFKAATGEVLRQDPPRSTVSSINTFLTGLHLQHFRHWLLRWLYVLGGLMGCVCIATGFIFFVEKRKMQHAKAGAQGARVVDAMAVTIITGMLIATLSLLIANRLLPEALPTGWIPRGRLEQLVFWTGWLLAMTHAFLRNAPVARSRKSPAWREQCLAVATMALAAVLLNWITTGDHLLKTVFTSTYWPVAGVDLFLLSTGGLAFVAARRLKSNADKNEPTRHSRTAGA